MFAMSVYGATDVLPQIPSFDLKRRGGPTWNVARVRFVKADVEVLAANALSYPCKIQGQIGGKRTFAAVQTKVRKVTTTANGNPKSYKPSLSKFQIGDSGRRSNA